MSVPRFIATASLLLILVLTLTACPTAQYTGHPALGEWRYNVTWDGDLGTGTGILILNSNGTASSNRINGSMMHGVFRVKPDGSVSVDFQDSGVEAGQYYYQSATFTFTPQDDALSGRLWLRFCVNDDCFEANGDITGERRRKSAADDLPPASGSLPGHLISSWPQ